MRHWNFKVMESLGFKVLGTRFYTQSAVLKYIIYRESGLLIFDGHTNQMYFVSLNENQLAGFKSDAFGLSFDGSTKGMSGQKLIPVQKTEFINDKFNLLRIENIVQMKKALAYSLEKYK